VLLYRRALLASAFIFDAMTEHPTLMESCIASAVGSSLSLVMYALASFVLVNALNRRCETVSEHFQQHVPARGCLAALYQPIGNKLA
jgi:hypothetical protein